MEEIVRAIYNKKQLLWFNALKRAVESPEYLGHILYSETFLAGIRKLRDVNIVESHKAPYKSKRVPIRLTKKAEERYKIGSLQIPDTYQLELVLKTKAFKRQPTIRKRRRINSGSILRGKIIQYFLSRAAMGCHYNIEVTGRPRQKGDYTIFKDENGLYYGPQDMMYLTREQKKRLIPVVGDGFSLAGVSITDLVEHRDSGCARVFRYLEVTERLAKKILDELLDDHILVPINSKSNTSESHPEIKYVIADPLLSSYIYEYYGLLFMVMERMELIWIADHPTKDEKEWYMYYYGMPQTSIHFDNIGELKVDKDKNANSRIGPKIKLYDQMIMKRIETIRNNTAYNKVRSDYYALADALKKTIEPFRSVVRMHDLYNF